MAAEAVAVPEEDEHPQAADLFAGMEHEVPEAWPDCQRQRSIGIAGKAGRPALRPADAGNQARVRRIPTLKNGNAVVDGQGLD